VVGLGEEEGSWLFGSNRTGLGLGFFMRGVIHSTGEGVSGRFFFRWLCAMGVERGTVSVLAWRLRCDAKGGRRRRRRRRRGGVLVRWVFDASGLISFPFHSLS